MRASREGAFGASRGGDGSDDGFHPYESLAETVPSDGLLDVAGRTYVENRPCLVPETLGELVGPVAGVVQLPLRLDWSERAEFHLDDLAERNVMYERVLREATQVDDLRSYLNEAVLRQVWRHLFRPARVRQGWEERFAELRLAA